MKRSEKRGSVSDFNSLFLCLATNAATLGSILLLTFMRAIL